MERLTMTVKELAVHMGVSLPTAYNLTEMQGFPVVHIGRKKVIPVEAFRAWLNEQRNGLPQASGR